MDAKLKAHRELLVIRGIERAMHGTESPRFSKLNLSLHQSWDDSIPFKAAVSICESISEMYNETINNAIAANKVLPDILRSQLREINLLLDANKSTIPQKMACDLKLAADAYEKCPAVGLFDMLAEERFLSSMVAEIVVFLEIEKDKNILTTPVVMKA